MTEEKCPICGRVPPDERFWEDHHLIPKSKKGRETRRVCSICHDAIHQHISNKELKKKFNTIEKIKEHPKMIGWTNWISKRPNQWGVCFREKK